MARERELILTANHQSILRLLMRKGKLSRKELSAEMGITPAAITRLSGELVKANLIKESEFLTIKNRVGRKQILLTLQERYGYVMTINLAKEATTIAITTIAGKVLQQQRFCLNDMPAPEFMRMLSQELDTMRQQLKIKLTKIIAVGITVPSGYDTKERLLRPSAGLWKQSVAILDLAQELFSWPCYVDEQLLAFAQAHVLYMGDYGSELLCLQWGDRLASVLLFNQAIYGGYHGLAGNIGHQIIKKNGLRCACGKQGCLTRYISVAAILESLIALYDPDQTPYLHHYWQKYGQKWNEEFFHLYMKALGETPTHVDALVQEMLEERLNYLASTIINATSLLDPQYVVGFGSLFEHDFLYRFLVEALMRIDESFPIHSLQRSWLSYQDTTIAGLALVMQERFFY